MKLATKPGTITFHKRFENTVNGSSKFWEIMLEEGAYYNKKAWTIVTKHGKIGTAAKTTVGDQFQETYNYTENQVLNKVDSTIKGKLRTGYVEVPVGGNTLPSFTKKDAEAFVKNLKGYRPGFEIILTVTDYNTGDIFQVSEKV